MFMSSLLIYVFIVCCLKSRFYFSLLVFFSTHAAFCLSVLGNIQVDSIKLLSTLATDGQQLGLNLSFMSIILLRALVVNFELLSCVLLRIAKGGICQILKTQVLCIQNSNLYYWQTMIKTMYLSCFRIAQSWFFVVKLD